MYTCTQYRLQLCLHVHTGIAYMYVHAYHEQGGVANDDIIQAYCDGEKVCFGEM